jgi:hypothetical protein
MHSNIFKYAQIHSYTFKHIKSTLKYTMNTLKHIEIIPQIHSYTFKYTINTLKYIVDTSKYIQIYSNALK